ncbi:hypothetical protein ABZR88_16885 [Mucilaginibacter yixingensis]|nr:hypothetical protein [Mucilaginibacter yixingensis]
MPDEHLLSPAVVAAEKAIATTAWLGSTGQDVYQMIIVLGPISLQRYLKGESITGCLPNASEPSTWVNMDTDARKISILLQ